MLFDVKKIVQCHDHDRTVTIKVHEKYTLNPNVAI